MSNYTNKQLQKQPTEVLCKKRCSQKFRKIPKKTPVLESTLLKKRVWHRCFHVNCEISKNTFFTERLWATASVVNEIPNG